jgi:3-methylfumaryl-CoA hydratase
VIDVNYLKKWIGRSETTTDVVTSAPLAGLAALLDHETPPWPGGELVPLGHWLNFLPRTRQSEMDVDGHPRRGTFMPPVPLPRRMWAGGRLTFHIAIPLGATLERRSTIADVAAKTGKSGTMVFVTVQHEITIGGRPAVSEEQDIVYREMPATATGIGIGTRTGTSAPPAVEPKTRAEPPRPSDWTRDVTPDPVQLFRFSALTFNAHRIHYDRTYCRDVEGYPGLVVHGPFIATLLLDHFLRRTPEARVTSFQFRAQRPLYDTAKFSLCMAATPTGSDLWTLDQDGQMTMTATVTTI